MPSSVCPSCSHPNNVYGSTIVFCSDCGYVGCNAVGSLNGKVGCVSMGKGGRPGNTCPTCRKGTLKLQK